MNKSLLMSFSPYWYYLICEGIKKIEVRKTIPQDPDWNRQIECYMTKDKKSFARIPKEFQKKYRAHMGKVGMRWKCDEAYNITPVPYYEEETGYKIPQVVLDSSCLFAHDIIKYLTRKDCRRNAYGLHISDLKIYNKPKGLGEFFRPCDGCDKLGTNRCTEEISPCRAKTLTRPPQSWCYVEGVEE